MASDLPERPQPLDKAPPKNALHETYVELLAIARERLAVAVRIERERGFIFPETTVIARDVRALAERVYGPAAAAAEVEAVEGASKAPCGPPAPAEGEPAEGEGDDQGDDVDAILAGLAQGPGGQHR